MMPKKALAKADKEKNYKYIHPCMESQCCVTSLIFSEDGIPGAEAPTATQIIASNLSFKLKREYSEI